MLSKIIVLVYMHIYLIYVETSVQGYTVSRGQLQPSVYQTV